jgi:hypothetical protein
VLSRRNSFDDDLEEFGHIALYGDMVDSDVIAPQDGYQNSRPPPASQLNELALRELLDWVEGRIRGRVGATMGTTMMTMSFMSTPTRPQCQLMSIVSI